MNKTVLRGTSFIFSCLLIVSIGVGTVLEANRNEIDGFFGTHSTILTTTDDGTLWTDYTPDEEFLNADGTGNAQAVIKAHEELGEQMEEEGAVLLKNNGALPLAKNSKITTLGIRSYRILAASGMGVTVASDQVIQLNDALSEYYSVNPAMEPIYEAWNATAKLTNMDRASASNFDPKEASVDYLLSQDADLYDTFEAYGDAAIVVVGRPSSEMGDYSPGEAGVAAGTGATTAMQMTTNEKETIELATEKFDKVIVLVNSNSAMEIDELKNNDKIDAILWVGHPGCYGTPGIANVLCGEANPSGKLADTYAADSLSAPAMMNMGNFTYSNDSSVFTRSPSNGSNNKYVIENEGIYTGYKYYETRYEDAVLNQGNATSSAGAYMDSTWKYTSEVSYTFGYGLSYTEFSQKIVDVEFEQGPHDYSADVTVEVTNTGSVAGKSVVQVYGQAPYISGGVEKASVQLLNYDKTAELQPGETTEITVHVDMQDLASWDSSANGGKGTWILDSGDYYFAIGNGAHEALNNILAKKGKTTADGMDANGNYNEVYTWTYNYSGGAVDSYTFSVSKAGVEVSNALETADWNYWEEGKITQLSRSDWNGTYPVTYNDLKATDAMVEAINGDTYDIKTNEDTSDILFDQDNGITFAEMKGVPYDDEKWDDFLDQLNLQEAMLFIYNGNRVMSNLTSLGFYSSRVTENGPVGIGGRGFGNLAYNNFGTSTPPWFLGESTEEGKTADADAEGFALNVFASAPVVASTFNPDIAYEEGRLIANDALFVGLPIIWGPGMNTHRHPYNGRSGEYYSEDAVLTGVMGMEFAIGALDKGLIAAPKHYAFNDQEQNRTGIAPYMTEQKAREGELRAYQIAFEANKYDTADEDRGMMGVMTSFSKIGPTEVTCSEGMLKQILRGEWGFNGYIVSDMNDDVDLFSEGLYAGMSSYDAGTDATWDTFKSKTGLDETSYLKDRTMLLAVKEAVHHTLYTLTVSNYMNGYNTSTTSSWNMTWWRATYITAISVTAVLAVAFVALTVVAEVQDKKRHN